MASLSSTQSLTTKLSSHASARAQFKQQSSSSSAQKRAQFRVYAQAEATKTEAAPKAPWSAPKLDPNTPSPIFGGSTGGLLRKAQVCIFASIMIALLSVLRNCHIYYITFYKWKVEPRREWVLKARAMRIECLRGDHTRIISSKWLDQILNEVVYLNI